MTLILDQMQNKAVKENKIKEEAYKLLPVKIHLKEW
jgi:hypothetical protein